MTGTTLLVSAIGTAKAMIAPETTAAAITLIMDNSTMMDNTLQRITQQQPFVFTEVDPEHYVTTTNDCQDNMPVLTSTHIHSTSVVLPSTNNSIYSYFSSNFQVAN